MTKTSLNVAQVGCGAFAADQDMRNFRENERVQCLWCCDLDGDRAKALAGTFGVPRVTTDFMDCINDPAVDVLKIATSHEAHLPIIEAAAKAGKHVFCEKPMALALDDCLKIIRAVHRSGIKLCVDLNRRMSPALQALRKRWLEHWRSPTHQPWRYVEAQRALYPEEERTQFLVRVQDDTLSYRMVHLDPLQGGGLLLGETVHWLDLSCWFFAPQRPVEVLAWGSARFSHGIHLTYSEGDTATIVFNCGGTFDYPKEMYEVASKGALFRSEFFVENRYFGVPGIDRETFPVRRDCLPDTGTEGGFSGWVGKYAARVRGLTNSKVGHGE
jgi:predicted dehydrogenase